MDMNYDYKFIGLQIFPQLFFIVIPSATDFIISVEV